MTVRDFLDAANSRPKRASIAALANFHEGREASLVWRRLYGGDDAFIDGIGRRLSRLRPYKRGTRSPNVRIAGILRLAQGFRWSEDHPGNVALS